MTNAEIIPSIWRHTANREINYKAAVSHGGGTVTPKQMSHHKFIFLLFFLVVGDTVNGVGRDGISILFSSLHVHGTI
jgi:hypothetical protein